MNTRNRTTIHPLNQRLAVLCLALFCAWTTAGRADTITVTNLADSGPGTLREALANAADGDTIDASSVTGTILLTGGELLVTNSVIILGPRFATLAVDGNYPNSTSHVFRVGSNLVVSISSLTITNGYDPGEDQASYGVGIYNDHSTLTISNCTFSGNSADNGGAIYNNGYAGSATLVIVNSTLSGNSADNGGAIYNDGYAGSATLTVVNSTLNGNSQRDFGEEDGGDYDGGGIYNDGGANGIATLVIVNSTLSGNSADYGGGVYNDGSANGSATLVIINSTLSGNSADNSGGGIYNDGNTGSATVRLGSTILNAGTLGENIYNAGGTVTSDGYNLSSDDGGGFLTATGDQPSTDPLLGPLADNGGPTFTHALSCGSPAIDAGTNFTATATDQRSAGFARTFDDLFVSNVAGGDGTDIGAYEAQYVFDWGDFPNGVAAGDVSQSNVWLWARAGVAGTVRFEYGRDPTFTESDGATNVVVDDPNVPAKAEIDGLQAGTQYYYRACLGGCPPCPETLGGARGEFRTPFSDSLHGLRFGVTSCWRGDMKPFVSIRNVPERDLDFFVALGDTAYADSDLAPPGRAVDLDGFRRKQRYNLTELYDPEDNFFAAARTSTAFYAIIDDHEVENNFAGGAPSTNGSVFGKVSWINETALFTNSMQAFHEYWPIREEYYGETGERRTANKRKLYRYRTFGKDAAMFLLDARSFRDAELGAAVRGVRDFERRSYEEDRTMLGNQQVTDLEQDLLRAHNDGIIWKFVLVGQPIQNIGQWEAPDRFEGYAWERRNILKYIEDHGIDNVVFISGDIHGTIANNLAYKEQRLPRLFGRLRKLTTRFGKLHKTSMWDISTGPAAYDAPFGPNLPVIGTSKIFTNKSRTAQNDFIEKHLNRQLASRRFPRIGLSGKHDSHPKLWDANLHPATLLKGQYLSINTFGWAEFEIDANANLTVTTWGIDWYKLPNHAHKSGYDVGKEYDDVLNSSNHFPFVVSKFKVTWQGQVTQ